MTTCLDAMHGAMHVGRELPGKHGRKTPLLKQSSKAIFSESLDDKKQLEDTRYIDQSMGKLKMQLTGREAKAD